MWGLTVSSTVDPSGPRFFLKLDPTWHTGSLEPLKEDKMTDYLLPLIESLREYYSMIFHWNISSWTLWTYSRGDFWGIGRVWKHSGLETHSRVKWVNGWVGGKFELKPSTDGRWEWWDTPGGKIGTITNTRWQDWKGKIWGKRTLNRPQAWLEMCFLFFIT